jgi:hypothetical protein
MNRLIAVAAVFFCFEIGLFLVIIPWSELWEGNYFLQYIPRFRPLIVHPVFRAAVTTLGIIDILIGVSELRNLIRALRGGEGRSTGTAGVSE